MGNWYNRHFLFWIAYSVENTLFEYTYIQAYFPPKKSAEELFIDAIIVSLILLPPKLLTAYFVMYKTIPEVTTEPYRVFRGIVETIIILLFSLYLHRLISTYLVNRLLYDNLVVGWRDVFNLARLFISLIDILYIAGFAVAIKLVRMQMINYKFEKELVKEKLGTELKFLKSQIHPHFLFNTLNSIYMQTLKKSPEAPETVLRLSHLLRFMLYESNKPAIMIEEEVSILESYVQLEKVRFSKRLKISVVKKIDNPSQKIAPLILLPFVENAFKHSARDTTEEIFIDIQLLLEDGSLTFVVCNSKEHGGKKEGAGNIGLTNIRRQLELIYKDFDLTIKDLDNTFQVSLHIDLNKNATI